MKATAAIALLISLGTPSSAVAAERAKLPTRDAIALTAALRALDGRQQVVKVNGQDTVITVPWEFGSGSLRLRIANNLAILSAVEQRMSTIQRAIFQEVTRGTDANEVKPGTPEATAFMKQYGEALDQPAAGTDDLARIKASELRLDRNEIAPSVLEALKPILDQD